MLGGNGHDFTTLVRARDAYHECWWPLPGTAAAVYDKTEARVRMHFENDAGTSR
jgi:hypothetical protein